MRCCRMHAVGLHSALAIKRQRKRRDEQRRAQQRRYSAQSGESGLTSPRASTGSLEHHPRHTKSHKSHQMATQSALDTKVVTSIGMLHIGVVFLVLGAFLLASGLLPGDLASFGTKASGGWWNELVAIGLFAVILGIFLIILNRVIAEKADNDLEQFVQQQLTRSKSGHRLERDVETGGLHTRNARRAKQMKGTVSSTSIKTQEERTTSESPPRSPPPAYSPPPLANGVEVDIPEPVSDPTVLYLEQITEEDGVADRLDTSTNNSLSPGSPSDTRELLQHAIHPRACKQNGHHSPHQLPQAHRPIYVSRI